MTGKNTTREFWKNHYQSFSLQGITQKEYCRTNGLGYWTFNKWKRKFDEEQQSFSFQEIPVQFQSVKTEKIQIVFNGTISIVVPESFSETTLKKIVSILKDAV